MINYFIEGLKSIDAAISKTELNFWAAFIPLLIHLLLESFKAGRDYPDDSFAPAFRFILSLAVMIWWIRHMVW